MMMGGHGGFSVVIPVTMLLTLCYFVLFSTQKLNKGGLKIFGYVIAVLLIISAAVVLGGGKKWYGRMMPKKCAMEVKPCASKMNEQIKPPIVKENTVVK